MENGVTSHDTFQRIMVIIEPKVIQQLQLEQNKYLNTNDGKGLKKILSIDGKTLRGVEQKIRNHYTQYKRTVMKMVFALDKM